MQSPEIFPSELNRSFDRQLKLCDELEAVADSLPARLDRQLCLHLAEQIGLVLRDAHAVEEHYLVPSIMVGERGPDMVDRLRWEHKVDEGYGEEIHQELLLLGRGAPVLPAEAVGYMLRGFFASMRRHIHNEMDLLRITALTHQPHGGSNFVDTRR